MMINTPKGIELFRLLTLRKGLELEIKGLKKRGQSCYQIIKNEFELTGNKQKVLSKFNDLIYNQIGGNKFINKTTKEINQLQEKTKWM